jgi:transposase-like protein
MSTSHDKRLRSPLDDPEWLADLDRTEDRCRHYLEDLRWPEGISCPRCDCHSIGDVPARRRHYCRGCRHHFSLTSGTVFHNSHLPIWKWFLVIELLLGSDAGVPANQLVELLGGSYKTSWFVEHRIRAALVQAGEPAPEAQAGTAYHGAGDKYRSAYRAESSWRARQKRNPDAFRNTVLALLAAEPVPYGELTRSQRSLSSNRRTTPVS